MMNVTMPGGRFVALFAVLLAGGARAEPGTQPANAVQRTLLLIGQDGLAAVQRRCLPAPAHAWLTATGIPGEYPWPDAGRLHQVYRFFRRATLDQMARPGAHSPLAAAAFCHLVEGVPGEPDLFTQFVAGELPRSLAWTAGDFEAALALGWCGSALPRELRQEAADRWAAVAAPISPELMPADTDGVLRRLTHFAVALGLADDPAAVTHHGQIQRVISAALAYPLPAFYMHRGPEPTRPQALVPEALVGVVYFELLRTQLEQDRFDSVRDTLGRTLQSAYALELTHPAAEGRTFPRHGGGQFPSGLDGDAHRLAPLVPLVLAERFNVGEANHYARGLFDGLLGELDSAAQDPLSRRAELLAASLASGLTRPFGAAAVLPDTLFTSPADDLAAAMREDQLPRALASLNPEDAARLWMLLLHPHVGTQRPPVLSVQPAPGVFRGGRGPDAAVVYFDLGRADLVGNSWAHAGSFQIFHRGFLTAPASADLGPEIDDGPIIRTALGDLAKRQLRWPGDFSHFSRDSASGNTLLVINPIGDRAGWQRDWPIEGGQRVHSTPVGDWTRAASAQERSAGVPLDSPRPTPELAMQALDLTACYPPTLVTRYVRTLAFLPPADVLVIDQVELRNGLTQPTWLLQLPVRPTVDAAALSASALPTSRTDAGIWRLSAAGKTLSVEHGEARMAVRTVWPPNCSWRVSGGPGEPARVLEGPHQGQRYFGSSSTGYEYWCGTRDNVGGVNAWFELLRPQWIGPHVAALPHWGRLQTFAPPVAVSRRDQSAVITFVHWLRTDSLTSPEPVATHHDGRLAIKLARAAGGHFELTLQTTTTDPPVIRVQGQEAAEVSSSE